MLHWHFYSAPTGEYWEVSGDEGPIARSPPFPDLPSAKADALKFGFDVDSDEISTSTITEDSKQQSL